MINYDILYKFMIYKDCNASADLSGLIIIIIIIAITITITIVNTIVTYK